MYICLCHAVTDTEILAAMQDGQSTLPQLMESLKVATNCGGCSEEVLAMLSAEQEMSHITPPYHEILCEKFGATVFMPATSM